MMEMIAGADAVESASAPGFLSNKKLQIAHSAK
jgi:hypothetical protein